MSYPALFRPYPHQREDKAALFEALATAGITSVVVEFDGAGDSGQIESITAFVGDKAVDLPAEAIQVGAPAPATTDLAERGRPLTEMLETMAYALLEEDHDGWEINDGAFGTFTFAVADRSIRLALNEWFTDVVLTEHAY